MKKAFFTVLILYFVISPSQQSDACFSENVDYKVLFKYFHCERSTLIRNILPSTKYLSETLQNLLYLRYRRTHVMLYKMKKGEKIYDFFKHRI